ncbi:hypothetical protein ACVNIS_14535 [Sphaerotilaceae bacterium SBD11-9]
MNTLHLSATLLAACLLSACATSYGPGSLPQGTSLTAAREKMGPPTSETPLPDGGRRVEYARGPMGKHTYMLYFDANNSLQKWEQVLDENHFNTIRSGMTAAEVQAIIGHATNKYSTGWTKQVVWTYRFETPFCIWFQVGMDLTESTVIDTAYGPDPMCEGRDNFRL